MTQPTKSTKKKTQHGQPHCRKCDSTEIEFTYTENFHGREIDEQGVLQAACYYLGRYIGQVATDDGGIDSCVFGHMSLVLADLATMMRVREEQDELDEKSAAAAVVQS